MGKAEVDAIIADVFRVSGIKLTADDPVIAILLVQESRLKPCLKNNVTIPVRILTELLLKLKNR